MATEAQLTLAEWLYFNGAQDETGAPVASGFAYFYQPGSTSVAIQVYSDTAGTPLAQPVALDAGGRAEVYAYDEYECKVVDALGATKRLAVRAGCVSGTAVNVTFQGSATKLDTALATIAAHIAAAAATVPVESCVATTISTVAPSFEFDPTKQTNIFRATYASNIGAFTITWTAPSTTIYSRYRIVIQTGTSTSATSTVFPASWILSTPPTTLAVHTYYTAEFVANAANSLAQVTPWVLSATAGW